VHSVNNISFCWLWGVVIIVGAIVNIQALLFPESGGRFAWQCIFATGSANNAFHRKKLVVRHLS